MKNFGIFFIMLFGIVFFASFQRGNNFKEEYTRTISNFPPELVSHFPDGESLQKDFYSQIFYQPEYSPLQFLVKQNESRTTIDSLISKSTKIPYSETSYYVVNKYLRRENILDMPGQYYKYENQKFLKDAVPIPNFYKLPEFRENTIHHLDKHFSIYLNEAKPKKCFSIKLHNGEWHMPTQWKDGYSKGYAINKKTNVVIYWFVIW